MRENRLVLSQKNLSHGEIWIKIKQWKLKINFIINISQNIAKVFMRSNILTQKKKPKHFRIIQNNI